MELHKALRAKTKLRLGISGASGSGKTYSALQLASGMAPWDKIAVIDSEHGSADLYSGMGPYNVLTLEAPFTPERYIEAMDACEKAGMEVLILDSISHEWEGEGGILEIHSKMLGNSFTNWAKLTPRHNAFIQRILQSPCHTIVTTRRKQDYDMSKDGQGKTTVTKVGLKEVARDGTEYEWTLEFMLDQAHMAEASKDRTGIFMGKPPFQVTKGTGSILSDWCDAK